MAVPVQPHHWRHALETSLLAGLVAWVAGAVAHAHGRSALPVLLAVLAAVTVAAFTCALAVTGRAGIAVYFGAWGLLVTGWEAYAVLVTPWTLDALTALAVGVVVLAPAGALLAARHADVLLDAAARAAEDARRAAAHADAAELGRWSELMDRCGFPGVQARQVVENRAGRVVHFRLPRNGRVTAGQLTQAADRIEAAEGLRRGSVRFSEPPESAADVVMHVADRDVLAEAVPFPAVLHQATITEPYGLGVREDGEEATVLMREVAKLVVGQRGTGKSNLLNVEVAQLARCTDAVIFAIDLKHRFVAQWVKPWIDGKSPRPVIDWIACDRDEAELMLRAVLAAIGARSRSGMGGEKLTPSRDVPAIILLADEVAVIFRTGGKGGDGQATNRALAELATQLTGLGRSEAIDPVWCALRGSVTTLGGGDLKAQCRVRIGLGSASAADAQLVVPDDPAAARMLARLRHPGTGIIGRDGALAAVKFYRLEPARIAEIAAVTGHYRPAVDPLTSQAMGAAYARRWDRARPLIDGWADVPAAERTDAAFARIVARTPDPEDRVDPARRRMRQLVAQAGPDGTRPGLLLGALRGEGLAVARETVSRWLTADERAGLVRKSAYGKWVTADPPAGG